MSNNVIEKFESLSEMIKELDKRHNNEQMKNEHSSTAERDADWAGTDTYEQAVEYALKGYEKPLESLKRGMIEAEARGTAERRSRTRNDIIGYVPNVPAAVIGLPQSMIRSDVEVKKSKVVSILYAPTQNCGTDAETINKAGVAVLSIVNNLEKSGYRVALSIMSNLAQESNDVSMAMVKIKDWRQPLDLKKVAFPLCCAAMQRRIGFKWLETCKGLTTSSWSFGYGKSIQRYEEARRKLDEAGLLTDKQFFINVELCQQNKFDPDKIAAACGIQKER